MNTDVDDVKAFYDKFLQSHLLQDRIYRNLRIERAVERILKYVTLDSQIVDIGCGIGIVAEQLGKRASQGNVWACDISSQNIWYATQTVLMTNVSFYQLDVVREFDRLQELLRGREIDVVVMVDVIEHLPKNELMPLFHNIVSFLSDVGKIIITYPSPYYQRFLYEENREELQIIDETIELVELAELAANSGLAVKHFSLEDVWQRNQYVHCVLARLESASNVALVEAKPGILQRITAMAQFLVFAPLKRHKYVSRVFGDHEKLN